jgi:hypothetical protein
MAMHLERVIGRSLKAVQSVQDALRSLRKSRLSPEALSVASGALDKLFNKLNSLATSPEALASSYAFDTLSTTISPGIPLFDALVLDMEAITERLRFMTPPDSSMIAGDFNLDNEQSNDIAKMVECYDRSVSFVLLQHNVCVRQVDAIL